MVNVANNILELIGNTPMVKINRLTSKDSAEVYAKLEYFNPMNSIKDRIGKSIIEAAEKDEKIKPGDTLIEITSGNAGVGLALASVIKGYNLVLVMSSSSNKEKIGTLKALGAKVILVEPKGGLMVEELEEKAKKLAEKNNWYLVEQFKTKNNPKAHKETTGVEILNQIPDLDVFVSVVGTGGTITGVGEALREKLGDKIEIIAVEPENSAVLSGGKSGHHKLQGVGLGIIPEILNKNIYNEIITVSDKDAINTCKELALKEGIFAGTSSGAGIYAGLKIAKKIGKGKKVVVIIPDYGGEYLSTGMFDN